MMTRDNYRTRYGVTAKMGRTFMTWAVVDNKDGTTVKRVIDMAQALKVAADLNEVWAEKLEDAATDMVE